MNASAATAHPDGAPALRIFACGETVDYAAENALQVARGALNRRRAERLSVRLVPADIYPSLHDFTQSAGLAHHTMQIGRQVVVIDKDRVPL